MNTAAIWWEQIGNSLRFLSRTAALFRDSRSAILHMPDGLPWRQEFYDALDQRRTAMGCDRRLIRLGWTPSTEPGQFVLDRLCDSDVAANYWPGQRYGEYLASCKSLSLRECCVWITGIHDKADLMRWSAFIQLYDRCAGSPERRAVFLLEYDGEAPERPGIDRIEYRVQSYDCRVFCLETAAALDNTTLPVYQAELAQRIGGADPEFCAALLTQGAALLHDPAAAVPEAVRTCRRRSGEAFAALTEQQISSAARKAATALLFPMLEQYRLDFVTAHQAALRCRLPITGSNGETVTDPFDLELGELRHIIGTLGDSIPAAESETIRLCHRVRNLLAHNKRVPCEDVRRILAL